ncbi:hypothetical protein I4F81_008487 [Pyropia yezoensis]|uniref:Uncharacterized protein n=1 Tax=Pyropia yezoensis TaxID=2788 RepID=A0ACC3C6W5_PYRYE|nr:hypothetical protein I4F81_008487 [Neopyropia yezoensis]
MCCSSYGYRPSTLPLSRRCVSAHLFAQSVSIGAAAAVAAVGSPGGDSAPTGALPLAASAAPADRLHEWASAVTAHRPGCGLTPPPVAAVVSQPPPPPSRYLCRPFPCRRGSDDAAAVGVGEVCAVPGDKARRDVRRRNRDGGTAAASHSWVAAAPQSCGACVACESRTTRRVLSVHC